MGRSTPTHLDLVNRNMADEAKFKEATRLPASVVRLVVTGWACAFLFIAVLFSSEFPLGLRVSPEAEAGGRVDPLPC